ncbi:MAG: CoA transferase, partial [Methyloligellaceae bacterium]
DIVSQERGPTQLVAQPVKLSRTGSSLRRPPPLMGQHTDEILTELGYAAQDIERMREEGVL